MDFVAGLAELLLLVVVVSLVVLFISTFVVRLEASFPNAVPWCSQRVRHKGGTEGEEEQSAASS